MGILIANQEFSTNWGAIAGVLIGVLAPNFSAYWSKKDSVGPRERALIGNGTC